MCVGTCRDRMILPGALCSRTVEINCYHFDVWTSTLTIYQADILVPVYHLHRFRRIKSTLQLNALERYTGNLWYTYLDECESIHTISHGWPLQCHPALFEPKAPVGISLFGCSLVKLHFHQFVRLQFLIFAAFKTRRWLMIGIFGSSLLMVC